MNWPRRIAALFALGFSAGVAAHTTSTGLATVTVEGRAVTWRLTLPLGELPEQQARLIASAADGDQTSASRVADALKQHLRVAAGGESCRSGRVQVQGSRGGDDRVSLQVAFACADAPRKLTLNDSLAEFFGEHYRSIASVTGPDGTRSERIFDSGSRAASFDLAQPGAQGWSGFVALGVEHILTGWDHLLFLAALLIGAAGVWRVLAIVTAFTVAHSLTLALAVLQVVVVPAAVIEPMIAASIVWVALENLFAPRASARRWLVSLVFGLVHGFGFAGALAEIGLSGWPLARALVGFNLGVEAGQAAAVVVFAPLFAWLARQPQARRYASLVSVLLALVGAGWFVERLLA